MSLIAPLDEGNPVPSCRNADGPYHQGQYVLTVDGFLVSDNVTVTSSDVVDLALPIPTTTPWKCASCWNNKNRLPGRKVRGAVSLSQKGFALFEQVQSFLPQRAI